MTYDEQVEAVMREINSGNAVFGRRIAENVLRVLGIEPPKPKWPTDESYSIAYGTIAEQTPQPLAHARLSKAFLADPIIKAAISYVKFDDNLRRQLLRDAVNEAGL